MNACHLEGLQDVIGNNQGKKTKQRGLGSGISFCKEKGGYQNDRIKG